MKMIEIKKSNLKYLWVDHEKVEYQGEDTVFATKNGETVCYKGV